jgi:hypothetical protein
MTRTRIALLIAIVCSSAASAIDSVVVENTLVRLRSQKGTMYAPVAEASKGQTLQVLETSGKWLKVQLGDKVGWIPEAELRPPSGGFASIAGDTRANVTGGPGASPLSESAAGKGLNQTTYEFGRRNNLSPKPLEKLVAQRNEIIASGKWQAFAAEGKVGAP